MDRRKFVRAVTRLGLSVDDQRGKASHAMIFDPTNPSRRATLPRRDPIAPGALRSVLASLGVSLKQTGEHL